MKSSIKHVFFILIIGIVNQGAHAQLGSISANPEECILWPGESFCSTSLSWTSSNASSVCAWRIHPVYAPAPFSCQSSNSGAQFNSIDTNGRTFELRYGSTSNYQATQLLDSVSVTAIPLAPSTHSGGSNFGWFYIEPSGCSSNSASSRFNYDVVSTFHLNTYQNLGGWQGIPGSTIISRLQAMYNAGQRSFRLPIYHRNCGKLPTGTSDAAYGGANCGTRFSGTASASDAGVLPEQAAQNVIDILLTAKSIGFERTIVSFLPQGSFNSPTNWTSINNAAVQENIGVISDIVQRTINSNGNTLSTLPELIWDLRNEHIPASSQSNLNVRIAYGQALWSWWTSNHNSLPSIGFTAIASSIWHVNNRFPNMQAIYGSNPPDAIAISLYSSCTESDYNSSNPSCDTESDIILQADQVLGSMSGYENIPLIISETYFNDENAATEIAAGALSLNRQLLFMMQWPRERGAVSNCFQSSVAPYVYGDYGF